RAWILFMNRQYDASIEQCLKTLETDRNFMFSYMILTLDYRRLGMHDKFVDVVGRFLSLCGAGSEVVADLNHIYQTSGINGAHRWFAVTGVHYTKQTYSIPYFQAAAYAEIGEKDKAFDCLEQIVQMRSNYSVHIGVDPDFDSLRSDARFADLVKRVGLVN
ncbi:MAG: hypothetical protein ABIA59_06980, partial [Candidatus Latescibacterota bacterium]